MDRQPAIERLQRELLLVLAGKVSFLEASRIISRLRFDLNAEDDQDFIAFVAIDSETDHLPVGSQRQYWSPDAVAAKNPEMTSAEEWARSIGEAAAQSLLRKFCHLESPPPSHKRMAIEVEINFRPANEIGRTNSLDLFHPTTRYRPHITVNTSTPPQLVPAKDRLGVEFPQQCEELKPGRPVRLRFNLLYPTVDYSALQPGVHFSVLEGPLLVGSGRVLRVIAPDAENSEDEKLC